MVGGEGDECRPPRFHFLNDEDREQFDRMPFPTEQVERVPTEPSKAEYVEIVRSAIRDFEKRPSFDQGKLQMMRVDLTRLEAELEQVTPT